MPSLLEELKMRLKEQKEEAQEGRGSFGFVFQFLEMEILSYEKQQEMFTEQEGWDKEEAILNEQVTLNWVKKRKGGKGVKNLRLDATTKKKSNLKSKYNIGKKQKGEPQKGELDRKGNKKGREKKRGEDG
uniref:Uncharacterized protein n=1 Tax=Micrurus corallinus TaxID=54390 RepID=A0A2D4FNG1_MICCO